MKATAGEPLVVFGLPVYNGRASLDRTLESLVSQTHRSLRIVAVDDASSDDSLSVLDSWAKRDGRVTALANERRLGLVGNWRRTFQLAEERFPSAPYFAWASDHDWWDPRWLAAMVGALEERPAAVLAYPIAIRMDNEDEVVQAPWSFETRGIADPGRRLRRCARRMVAGDMIYGLFRTRALAAAGPLPKILLPDRLHLALLSVRGEFLLVREPLWRRRILTPSTIARQRRSLFSGGPPIYAYLPWWATHTAILVWRLLLKRVPSVAAPRARLLRPLLAYLGWSIARAGYNTFGNHGDVSSTFLRGSGRGR